ncbi:UDP-N-acetylglucosamine--N-acetylmuramyl-(pentapeptide) pyrophosphoryl-undecaprenol N-acetylglucosamine transferase [Flavobacteriales bacterium]|nr:UDP-N-acetylglucosamine--N-acetylmuramyl-(pentapeptide) pyrophosphoryl-undecaprenol N-acetylglucosamine transferase [Flavobacteriales bacterium]
MVISGGGTGGHIHPALAIADEIIRRHPECDIQFVGAIGRMEMVKVPHAGYPITGLWITGIDRNWKSIRNLLFPFKLIHSLINANRLIRKWKPQIAIGVGGFASGPLLQRASVKKIPTLIQEQNSFPGITNRILAKRVDRICAGFPGLDRWFPADRIVETGNPLRQRVAALENTMEEEELNRARLHFGFDDDRPLVFVMGGSLGALSMNKAVQHLCEEHANGLPFNVLWQCGGRYETPCKAWLESQTTTASAQIRCHGFIDRMDWAYAAADVIASRAGAMSIAELALVGKPTILVPSPFVAEDHQTRNAESLSERGGAILLKDQHVVERLGDTLKNLLEDTEKSQLMSKSIQQSARPDAAARVVDAIESLIEL